jgi:hypothetical protein
VRERFRREAQPLPHQYSAVLWATRRWYRNDPVMFREVDSVLRDLIKTFGLSARVVASLGGRFVYRALKKEVSRVADEPPTFYERSPELAAVRPVTTRAELQAA